MKQFSEQHVHYRQTKQEEKETIMRGSLEEVHNLQITLLEKRCTVELQQATAREKGELKALQKTHANNLKRQPKILKQNEAQMRRIFSDTLRSQTKVFETQTKQMISTLSKEQKTDTLKSQKKEQAGKLAEMEEQYKHQIAEMTASHTSQMESMYKDMLAIHRTNTEVAAKQLQEYQTFREKNLKEKQAKELLKLNQDLSDEAETVRKFAVAEKLRCDMEDDKLAKLVAKHEKEATELRSSAPIPFP